MKSCLFDGVRKVRKNLPESRTKLSAKEKIALEKEKKTLVLECYGTKCQNNNEAPNPSHNFTENIVNCLTTTARFPGDEDVWIRSYFVSFVEN